eukprot:tig00000123_g6911.t1
MPTCDAVPFGSVALPGSSFFTYCPGGTVPNPERSYCVPCGKGNYESGWVCRPCIGTTYTPTDNATECLACDAGFVAAVDHQSCMVHATAILNYIYILSGCLS